MKKLTIAMAALAIVVWCSVSNVNARGGRGGGGGGGGRGGGGGGMSRGGGGGGMSRPSPAARPSPASRPSAAARPSPSTRPATGGAANRSPSLSRPGGASPSTRPGGAGGLAGGAGGAGRVGAGAGAGAGTRPSQRQLNDFLGIQGSPKAGTGAATGRTASGIQSGSKTVTGPGGGSITVGGIGGSRTGPGGGTAAAGRVGVKVTGPGGNSYVKVGGGAAVRGPGGNTIAAGRGASFVNGQFVGGKTWGAVNGNFNRWGYYGAGWHAGYPGAWWPGKWAVAGTIWAAASWATAGSYCGCSEEPTYYDYGDNVTYQDGMVYESDQPVGTEQQYYDQASQIAATGQEAANEDWLPLGVFAFCKDGDSSADKLVQLAVNKDGVIRGNYHDVVADKVTPIKGAVDKKTQRVALQLEGNSSLVVETGLYNLTNDEAPVLVHLGKDDTVSRVLVRLKQPEGEAAANGG